MSEQSIDQTLSRAQNELSKWQSPESFIVKVEAVNQLLESPILFNKTNLNFVFDAFVLAEFIKLRPPRQVRLAGPGERWPDGFTGTPRVFDHIEITEVIEPGRRRGQEYRRENINQASEADRPADWRGRAEQIPGALEAAIKRKIEKRYGVKPLLIIELNINDYGLLHAETVAAIFRLKAQYGSSFQEICVIWKGSAY
jgi:hypothetical protein